MNISTCDYVIFSYCATVLLLFHVTGFFSLISNNNKQTLQNTSHVLSLTASTKGCTFWRTPVSLWSLISRWGQGHGLTLLVRASLVCWKLTEVTYDVFSSMLNRIHLWLFISGTWRSWQLHKNRWVFTGDDSIWQRSTLDGDGVLF